MLVIMKACKHWKYYIESASHMICVFTDHMNIHTFFNGKILKPQETRWWEKFSGLDLTIKYLKGKSYLTNTFSHWPNYYWDQTEQEFIEMYCVLEYVTQKLIKS